MTVHHFSTTERDETFFFFFEKYIERKRDQSIIWHSFPSFNNTTWNQTQSTYQNRNIKQKTKQQHKKSSLMHANMFWQLTKHIKTENTVTCCFLQLSFLRVSCVLSYLVICMYLSCGVKSVFIELIFVFIQFKILSPTPGHNQLNKQMHRSQNQIAGWIVSLP